MPIVFTTADFVQRWHCRKEVARCEAVPTTEADTARHLEHQDLYGCGWLYLAHAEFGPTVYRRLVAGETLHPADLRPTHSIDQAGA